MGGPKQKGIATYSELNNLNRLGDLEEAINWWNLIGCLLDQLSLLSDKTLWGVLTSTGPSTVPSD